MVDAKVSEFLAGNWNSPLVLEVLCDRSHQVDGFGGLGGMALGGTVLGGTVLGDTILG